MASKNKRSFVLIERNTLKSDAWKQLNNAERVCYLHLKSAFNGKNNGELHLTKNEMISIMAKNTFYRSIDGLEAKGWIETTFKGGLMKQANRYKLTGRYDYLPEGKKRV